MWSGLGSQFKKSFCFEQFRLENLDFEEKIKSWWGELRKGEEHSMYNFQQNLKGLKAKIKKWNKEEFGNIFLEKKRLEFCLQVIKEIGENEPTLGNKLENVISSLSWYLETMGLDTSL